MNYQCNNQVQPAILGDERSCGREFKGAKMVFAPWTKLDHMYKIVCNKCLTSKILFCKANIILKKSRFRLI